MKTSVLDDPQAVKRLQDSMDLLLSTKEMNKILRAYDIMEEPRSGKSKAGLLALITDLRFYLPVLLVLEGWKSTREQRNSRAYRYHFHQVRNPWC